MAEKQQEKPEHKSKLTSAWEWAQNLGIIFSFIMLGSRETPTPGSEKAKASVPDWILHLFPSFTKQDEIEFLMMLYLFPDKQILEIEAWFRKVFVIKGYDETYYRLMLVGMWREFWDRIHNPPPESKNKGWEFKKITFEDPCHAFLQELLGEYAKEATAEEKYESMEKIGVDRGLLIKVTALKKVFRHRWIALATLIAIPTVLIATIIKALLWAFGF